MSEKGGVVDMSRGNATPLFSAPLYKTHLILSSENASPTPSAHRPPVLSPFCLFIRDPRGCPCNPADWVQESMLTVSCWLIGIKKTTKKNSQGRVGLFSSNPTNPTNPTAHNVAVHPLKVSEARKPSLLQSVSSSVRVSCLY